jgi:hypothetical protein
LSTIWLRPLSSIGLTPDEGYGLFVSELGDHGGGRKGAGSAGSHSAGRSIVIGEGPAVASSLELTIWGDLLRRWDVKGRELCGIIQVE